MAQLTFNLPTGSARVELNTIEAVAIQKALAGLLDSLKTIAKQTTVPTAKPSPQSVFEYRQTDRIFLEIFCNPNLYPSPFAAKVLLTIRDTQLRLTIETELTQMIEDVNQFVEANS
jgi:hypothetical protein